MTPHHHLLRAASSGGASSSSLRAAPAAPSVMRVRVAAPPRPPRAPSAADNKRAAAASGNAYPGFEEEKEVSHEAFVHAFEASRPKVTRIPGLQQFAASVWERRRRIPSTTYADPLLRIFDEFDTDSDGSLTAGEVAAALRSRGVDATPDAIQAYIDAIDDNNNGTVEKHEFAQFVYHMASAELSHSVDLPPPPKAPAAAPQQ